MNKLGVSITLAVVLVSLVAACTETGLQEIVDEEPDYVDNLLDIHGEYCTAPAEEMEFPVKILIVMDQSASLQCTDEAMLRRTAVQQLAADVRSNPSVQMGYLGFHAGVFTVDFTTPDEFESAMGEYIVQLGPATDYQGVLSGVLQMIERDLIGSPISLRARTKYVVIFVSDGVPEPRCLAGCEDDTFTCDDGEDNDGDGIIDGADEDCAIDPATGQLAAPDRFYGVCNTDEEIGDSDYIDMRSVCPEYNMEAQILRKVDDLVALGESYGVGDLTLHTVFLFAPQDVVDARCGGSGAQFGYVRDQAQPLLQAMAEGGRGVFREVNVALESEGNFLQVDYQPLESAFDLTETIAVNQNSLPAPDGLRVDTDADGVDDDAEFDGSLNRFESDTDNDGYSDLFERRHANAGFDPINGNRPHFCCPAFELEDTCCEGPGRCRCFDDDPVFTPPLSSTELEDRDGDGLNTAEERFLGTNERDPDTDGDRLPDGLEFRLATDPTVADALSDHDFDGVRTRDEARAASDPQVPDAEIVANSGVTYAIEDRGEDRTTDRHCYEFEVNNVELVTTLQREGVDGQGLDPESLGLNRVYLMMMEEPVELAGHRGNLFLGCVEATYLGEQYKSPPDGLLDLQATREACSRACLGCNEYETVTECRTRCIGRHRDDPSQCTRCDEPCNLFHESEVFEPEIHCVSELCQQPEMWSWRDVDIDGQVSTVFMCDDACVSDGYCNCNCAYDCDCNPYRTERCSTIRVCGS